MPQYDANNFKTVEIKSIWTGSRQEVTQVRHFNNAGGKPVATYRDSLKAGNWNTYQIDSAKYDANGNKIEELTLAKVFGVLTRTIKKEMTYTTDNQLISGVIYSILGNLYFPFQKITYTDAGGDNLVNEDFQFNTVMPPADPAWTSQARIIWGPAIVISDQNITTYETLMEYPNPASSTITLVGLKANPVVRIISYDGKEILAEPVNGGISISTLPAGIYLLYVSTHGVWKVFVKE